jgi:steroid delta-isomerase-like uncharacterized protein
MTAAAARNLIREYYERFNSRDVEPFLALLAKDVVHDISQGRCERGRPKFRAFQTRMNRCYREHVRDLVIMVGADGNRAAAEFMIDGEYLQTDGKFPKAKGQKYTLRVGAFFEIKRGRITRISNHYNLQDWLKQIMR